MLLDFVKFQRKRAFKQNNCHAQRDKRKQQIAQYFIGLEIAQYRAD